MGGLEQSILSFVQNIYQTIGWPGVFLLMAVESACIPLPSEIIMPLAGWMLIKDLNLGPEYIALAAAVGAAGNLAGSAATYLVGRAGGRRLAERYGRYVLISEHDLQLADGWFNKYGRGAAFFSRLLPIVRTFISLPAGIAKTPFARFCAYTFAGAFLWSGALAYGGFLLGQHWDEIRTTMSRFDVPIAVAIVALIAWFIVRRLRNRVHVSR